MFKRIFATSSAVLAAVFLPLSAQAENLMQVTVTGTVSAGFDAYRNSVYFGNDGGYNLSGQTASVSLIYDADLAGPNYPGYAPNWDFRHAPNYPAFMGLEGGGPVKSASFSINGITLGVDVRGPYEVHSLHVENPAQSAYGQGDSYVLSGMDSRFTWCPNDGQCAEAVQISAYQSYGDDLFGGQRDFSPANAFTALAAPSRVINAYVRMIQSPLCLDGGAKAGACPEGRFTDGQTHWVEFSLEGSRVTVASVTAVPEPNALLLLLAGGLAVLPPVLRRRRISR